MCQLTQQKFYQLNLAIANFVEVSLAPPVATGAGRTLNIGLNNTIKTKLNNFKGIQNEETNDRKSNLSCKMCQLIQQKFYQLNLAIAISLRCHWLRLWQAGAGRTVNIDLKSTVKTKFNNLKVIENETTNILNQIYPIDVSGDTAKVLPIKPRVDDFVEVLVGQPIAQGAGRSISIDLKETIKTKINDMQTTILEGTITATQVQPAMINSATKTVSLLPIENMDTNLLNIFRRSVGPVHGQKHSVAFDLSDILKGED
jgi:hypothetical protein